MLWLTACVASYTIAIAGAQGRLGRELAMQSIERGWDVVGVVRRPDDPVLSPVRTGWLEEAQRGLVATSPLAPIALTTDPSTPDADAMVFCMSGGPFAEKDEMDAQTEVVRRMLETCPPSARVCLVSAFGAGDSLEASNVGIRLMHSFYLKETYAAKEAQEALVRASPHTFFILRPRVLSIEPIPFNDAATPRRELARGILNWVACGVRS